MTALDTHVVVWLHAGRVDLLPEELHVQLDREPAVISPMVLLELEYLREIDRIAVGADEIFADLSAEIGLSLCTQPFAAVIRESLKQTWTRDPFDRVIVAQSIVAGDALATKDDSVLQHCPTAFWQ